MVSWLRQHDYRRTRRRSSDTLRSSFKLRGGSWAKSRTWRGHRIRRQHRTRDFSAPSLRSENRRKRHQPPPADRPRSRFGILQIQSALKERSRKTDGFKTGGGSHRAETGIRQAGSRNSAPTSFWSNPWAPVAVVRLELSPLYYCLPAGSIILLADV